MFKLDITGILTIVSNKLIDKWLGNISDSTSGVTKSIHVYRQVSFKKY